MIGAMPNYASALFSDSVSRIWVETKYNKPVFSDMPSPVFAFAGTYIIVYKYIVR